MDDKTQAMPEAHAIAFDQALALWRQGDRTRALAELRRACELAPDNALYPANLSSALTETGDYIGAEQAARTALLIAPERAASWHGLGNALTGQKRWLEAAEAYERAATLDPNLPNCDRTAADAWQRAGKPDRALQRFLRLATGVQGRDDPVLLAEMAKSLTQLNQVDEPLRLYREIAERLPDNAAAHCNLGTAYQALGEHDEAVACQRRAISLDPTQAAYWSNLIISLNYSPSHGPQDLVEAARGFDAHVCAPLRDARPHLNARDPEKRLRVGYVSPDLHRHAVAYFALPLIEGHTGQVEVVCYNSHRQFDDWTARFKKAAHLWVDCADWSDETLAERIRADGVDILVDLAGHTENNRLLVFARKPAPIQLTWLGYVTTTGVKAIDWRLTYPEADPAGAEANYTEKLWRLPTGMWVYRPLDGMPEVAPAPVERKGCVTFGHFNRFTKVTSLALETWARILSQVPNSRLLIGLPVGRTRVEIARFFEQRGIAAHRIDAFDKMPHADFWAMHALVDIALDPFPFNGGTTSYETLWMGVPLVTCTGGPGAFAPRFASRMGATVLAAIGLPELVAQTPDEYVRIAVALANDIQGLVQLRRELRERMRASVLLQEDLHVRETEAAYRAMWREWCAAAS